MNTYQDELFPEALKIIKETKLASVAVLQRRLKIGYNRAARLMEDLQAYGIVGPYNAASPREIFK